MTFKGAFLNIELISEKTAAYWIQVCLEIYISILNIFRMNIILLYVFTLHRAFFQGVKELKADFPEKVVSASIMCRFYISSRHHHSCKLREPLSFNPKQGGGHANIEANQLSFFTVTAKRTGRSLLNLL